MIVIIDDATEMTKEMWEHLGKVTGERVMDEDIIVTLKRSNDLLMTFGNDYSDVFLPAIDEIERLRNAIKVQSNAVRVLHEAETSELNHLRKNAQEAYTAKATLDSEREANKILTDEIERLRVWNNLVENKWMWIESALQFIAMAKPLDGQTWEKHSKQIKDYAIKALEWKEPD